MDCNAYKTYLLHDLDTRQYLENYFSDNSGMAFAEDALLFPIECLRTIFKEGQIKGEILIDLTFGSMVHHLYSACEFFKDIIVLKASDRCIMELKRWVDTRTGAFDWGHAAKLHVEMEGSSDQFQDKEEKVRSALRHVVKCNFEKENMTDPLVLPPADCIITAWLFEAISTNQEDYLRVFRKFSKLIKPGGNLILIGSLDATHYTVGKEKFQTFTYNEDFVRKVLAGEGFVIDYCKAKERTAVSDQVDYKAILFMAAHKKN